MYWLKFDFIYNAKTADFAFRSWFSRWQSPICSSVLCIRSRSRSSTAYLSSSARLITSLPGQRSSLLFISGFGALISVILFQRVVFGLQWCIKTLVSFLFLLNVDKFVRIRYPLHYRRLITHHHVIVTTVAFWIGVLFLSFFNYYGASLDTHFLTCKGVV